MRGAITVEYGWLDGGGKSLPVNSPNCSQAASVLLDELPREAFVVRGACSRCRTVSRLTTAPASWTHSKRFAKFGCGFVALRPSRLCGLTGRPPTLRIRQLPEPSDIMSDP